MNIPFIPITTIGYFLALLALPMPLTAADNGKLVIVLDASNSMWGQTHGSHKITQARLGLETLLAQQPAQAAIGLITYGNRYKSDCHDISIAAKPGEQDIPSLLQHINGIAPYGRSPISASLEQAAALLGGEGNILLVSDGPESCQGDPCMTASRLKAEYPAMQIHVLSFGDALEPSPLHCLADSTGGQFALISEVSQLAQQLLPAAATPPATRQNTAVTDNTPATLTLSVGASGSDKNLTASYLIYTDTGEHVASLTARTEANQVLVPGKYQVNVLWRTTKQQTTLELAPGQNLSHHFDLGLMGKLYLAAVDAQQQPVEASYTLYSPKGDYLTEHLLKTQVSDTLPIGTYRIKANLGNESQETQLDINPSSEAVHTFQFRQGQ
ncbi:vWA domain-containing protein [Thiothrix lacustris]|uniref:vWA domain-containing protein n=1 Tax=Thiothrix lacustris TaxID=525917 RepID=UPI0027E4067B|nr:VWA domain-containing protein [Thiothrix lacustris]WMP18598.1 VWA domain-containing protein [Thiothrix lacustris]